MKFIFAFSLLLLLVSCGTDEVQKVTQPNQQTVVEETVSSESVDPTAELEQDTPANTEEATSEKEIQSASEQSVDDIDAAMQDITKDEEELVEAKPTLEKITTTYKNPKQTVNVAIEYTVDSAGAVKTMSVSSDNYNLNKFNSSIQSQVIGKKKEDINVYVAGESLASDAFNAALK